MIFEKHINGLSEYLKMRNFSNTTISSYCFQVKKFLQFISENYLSIKNITQISKNVITDYLDYLLSYKDRKNKPLKNVTIAAKIISLRSFFRFLIKNDFILKNPAVSIELPKREKALPKNILTQKEVKNILNSIDIRTPVGLRDKTITEVYYATGMRTSELCDLKITDIDFNEQTVIIRHGKGDKTRILPLGQYAVEYLQAYLEKARKYFLRFINHDEGYLFLNSRGAKFNRNTINRSVMHNIVKNLKLNKKITCYSMRHAIASHLVQNKVNIRFVQELLGHENLNTTQKYCHINITDLKKMHSLYHPREISNDPVIKEENNN